MRQLFVIVALIAVVGCSDQAVHESTITVAESSPLTGKSKDSPQENEDKGLSVGTVARIDIEDQDREKNLNDRLHFCVFENGKADYIYVGTKYGMWSRGQFDLTIDGKTIFTGDVPHLVYSGVVIQMGDVLAEQPRSNIGVHITRVTGMFK